MRRCDACVAAARPQACRVLLYVPSSVKGDVGVVGKFVDVQWGPDVCDAGKAAECGGTSIQDAVSARVRAGGCNAGIHQCCEADCVEERTDDIQSFKGYILWKDATTAITTGFDLYGAGNGAHFEEPVCEHGAEDGARVLQNGHDRVLASDAAVLSAVHIGLVVLVSKEDLGHADKNTVRVHHGVVGRPKSSRLKLT